MVRWCAVLVVMGVVIAFCTAGSYGNKRNENRVQEFRTDIVYVDSANSSDRKERPAVLFYHDLHTDAMDGKKDGCKTCHKSISGKGGKEAFHFIPIEKASKDERMKAYHQRCIGCHTTNLSSGKDAGPVICSGCHVEKPKVKSSSVSARFDKSLHQRHLNGLDKSCQSCHHEYNAKDKKLFYKKGQEGSCSYCHPVNLSKKVENDKTSSLNLKQSSHLQCVVCHEARKNSGKKAGPQRCEECHDNTARKSVAKAPVISRLNMGQKDFMMMKNEREHKPGVKKNRMDFVPFDHKNHEMKNESCRVCHHKALTSCVTCHTAEGSAKGGNINLEKVMHLPKSERSCSGCHEMKRKTADCSGCHSFDVNWVKDERKSCVQCHVVSKLNPDESTQASSLIYSRIKEKQMYDGSKIPDRIVINKLEKKYKPVVFPHRKIVNTLYSKINTNRMAQYFHHDKASLCMGCHHNSPATANPTACSNCHNTVGKDSDRKPGLLGAYHIQCMECHAKMNIRQPESCTACHKEK